jgi:hypothetical protein
LIAGPDGGYAARRDRAFPVSLDGGPIPAARIRCLATTVSVVLSIAVPFLCGPASAQSAPPVAPQSPASADTGAVPLRDIGDVLADILGRPVPTETTLEPRPGLSLTVLPSIGYNPAYGAFIGASIALAGWLGDPHATQLSSGSIGGSYSTTGQISLHFKSDFFLPENRWALKGDWRYLDTSQPTYGIGPASAAGRSEYPMEFVLYRLYQTVYRRVRAEGVYVGLGYHLDIYDEIRDLRAEAGESTPFSEFSDGAPTETRSSGISGNVLIDTRDNPINATRGVFWNASVRSYNRWLGSDENRQSLWSDFRSYSHLPGSRRNILAIWNYYWFTFGNSPYLELPAIGWDTYGRGGRGYIQGHIRGPNQIYLEFEYRRHLTRDGFLGAVAFVNSMMTSEAAGGAFAGPDLGYGAGVRIKFKKQTATNLAVDAAWGQDEKVRFFFGLQEVF